MNKRVLVFLSFFTLFFLCCDSQKDSASFEVSPIAYSDISKRPGLIENQDENGFPVLTKYYLNDSIVNFHRMYAFNEDSILRRFSFFNKYDGNALFTLDFDSSGHVTSHDGHVLSMNYSQNNNDTIKLYFEIAYLKSFITELTLSKIEKGQRRYTRVFEYFLASSEAYHPLEVNPFDSSFMVIAKFYRKHGFLKTDTLYFEPSELSGGKVELFFGESSNHSIYLNELTR